MTERPLTIVHTEASRGWGGQDMRVLRECEWFRGRGHKVFLVTPPGGELFSRAKAAGFEPIPMALTKKTQFGDFFRLRSLFNKLRPDMVGTHSSVDSRIALMAATSAGVPCRVRYRHVSSPVRSNPVTAWQYRRLATHVITTGDSISAHLVKELGLPPERVSCISTGISPPPELPSREASREEIARELGLDEGTRFVGQVSVLRGWKGTTDLIAAFESFAAARPKFHLLIIGDGPQRQALATTIASSRFASRMHLLGHRENPWRYFAGMEVCALCSTASEGIPQALMQAMCAGTSVVGTSVGGIPEVVLHGVTGLIVPPASPAELARAIQECLDDIDRSEAMRKAASEMIRNTRTLDHMGDSVTAIIRRDLAANGRR